MRSWATENARPDIARLDNARPSRKGGRPETYYKLCLSVSNSVIVFVICASRSHIWHAECEASTWRWRHEAHFAAVVRGWCSWRRCWFWRRWRRHCWHGRLTGLVFVLAAAAAAAAAVDTRLVGLRSLRQNAAYSSNSERPSRRPHHLLLYASFVRLITACA